MKKGLFLLFFILLSVSSFAQYTNKQSRGNINTLDSAVGAITSGSAIILKAYVDTASANANSYVKNYAGAMIFVISENKVRVRNSTKTRWDELGSGTSVTVASYGKNASRDSTVLLLSDGTRYAARDSIGEGSTPAIPDTTVAKFPLYVIQTVGEKDSIAVYGVDSSFQNATMLDDSTLRLTRFNGENVDLLVGGATQYDLEGYIPLSGTVAGKPVTGTIEFDGVVTTDYNYSLFMNSGGSHQSVSFDDDISRLLIRNEIGSSVSKIHVDGTTLLLAQENGSDVTSLSLSSAELTLNSNDPTSKGLVGNTYFSPKDYLTYTQKHDIDLYADSLRQEIADTAAAIRADFPTGGSGTVTSVSDLSPLFTTADPTTTPTFSLSNAGAYTVFGNQTSGSTTPSYGKLNVNSIDATGTPGSGTFLRGDGSWTTGNLSPWSYNGSDIYFNTGKVGLNTSTPEARFTIRDNSITVAPDSSKGIYLVNSTAATLSNSKASPYIYFEGTGYNVPGSLSKRSLMRIGLMPDANSVDGTAFHFDASIDGTGGNWSNYTRVGTAGVYASRVYVGNSSASYFQPDYIKFSAQAPTIDAANSNQVWAMRYGGQTMSNSTAQALGEFNRFDGTMSASSGQTPTQVFASFKPVINWTATAGAGSYEGVRINVTETSVPTGNKWLLTGGTGGGSYTRKFGIANTGQVVVGGSAPAASSALDVQSTTQGFLPPRMTGTQAEAISSPAEGLLIYSTDGTGSTITSKGWWGYDGSTWSKLN